MLQELIQLAPRYAPEDFYTLIQQRSVAVSNTDRARASVARQLTAIVDRLSAIEPTLLDSEQALERIVETASALLRQVQLLKCRTSPRRAN